MATRVVRQLRLEFSLFAVELCSEAFERDRTETETTERKREREKGRENLGARGLSICKGHGDGVS